MQGGSALAVGTFERTADAAELFEASFFGVGQFAGLTVFDCEDVPSWPLGNDTIGGFPESTMMVQAATVSPTVRPGSFVVQIPRDLGTQFKQHSVEGRGCLEVGNTTQHGINSGGQGGPQDCRAKYIPASCLEPD